MNIPESKPAADWASEWLGYNVGSEQKRLVEWIDEIKANAAAHARHKALTEAATALHERAGSGQSEALCALETKQCAKVVEALRDAKET